MEKSKATENKMIELADQVLRSTRAGKLNWQEGVRRNSYTVHFPDISLSIVENRDRLLTLELINDKGTVIETLSRHDLGDFGDSEDDGAKLREIYDIARRQAVDVDGTIGKAIEYLGRGLG